VPSGRFGRFAGSLRTLGTTMSWAGLVLVAAGFLAIGRVDLPVAERIRGALLDLVTPVISFITAPVAVGEQWLEQGRSYLNVREENLRLKDEVQRLTLWQEAARRLEKENAGLRALNGVRLDGLSTYVTARVVAATGGPFARAVLVDAGNEDGIARGMAAVNGEGVVGRVVGTGNRAARILLLTDINSRVPVRIEPGNIRGILVGDNSARLSLDFLPPGARVNPGDRIVTSGQGGIFPPDLPVGTVIAAPAGAKIDVAPFVDFERLDYLRLVKYQVPITVDDRPNANDPPLQLTAPKVEGAKPAAAAASAAPPADAGTAAPVTDGAASAAPNPAAATTSGAVE